MKLLTQRLCVVILGTIFSLAAHSQPGGGGGGGFGGGGGGGGGGFGGDAGAGNPAEEEPEPEAPPVAEALVGRWDIEFRVDYFSADPEASGKYLEVEADIFLSGDQVQGRIREQDIRGEFSCTFDGFERCEFGMMRFQGEEQDWQDFGFAINRVGVGATGWAEWIDVRTGEIKRFELRMRKR